MSDLCFPALTTYDGTVEREALLCVSPMPYLSWKCMMMQSREESMGAGQSGDRKGRKLSSMWEHGDKVSALPCCSIGETPASSAQNVAVVTAC